MQHLFSAETYQSRRKVLAQKLGSGSILLLGNEDSPMNYADNTYPFRQDSNFLYYFGINRPGLAAVIDAGTGASVLYGNEYSVSDIVWIGPHQTLSALGEQVGVNAIKSLNALGADLKGKTVHYPPPYRDKNVRRLAAVLERPGRQLEQEFSSALVNAIINQRSYKSPEEIAQIEFALATTADMHYAVMCDAEPGMRESELAGVAYGIALRDQVRPAYPIILTVNGQTLHNHSYHNILKEDHLVLADMGAASKMDYSADITRTFPVAKTFSQKQKAIYEIVLRAEESCILDCRPGVKYRDVHLNAARIITQGLKELGLMQGDIGEAIAQGAHALFFPHGLGHMMGLDTHDMEDLGEQYVGYDNSVSRSDQFGLAYLRLARSLEAGFVLTVEPGIYFIPELIHQWKENGKHRAFIHYEKVESYLGFGGIRIEDNILITEAGNKILGPPIPKSVAEIEALRNI